MVQNLKLVLPILMLYVLCIMFTTSFTNQHLCTTLVYLKSHIRYCSDAFRCLVVPSLASPSICKLFTKHQVINRKMVIMILPSVAFVMNPQ